MPPLAPNESVIGRPPDSGMTVSRRAAPVHPLRGCAACVGKQDAGGERASSSRPSGLQEEHDHVFVTGSVRVWRVRKSSSASSPFVRVSAIVWPFGDQQLG